MRFRFTVSSLPVGLRKSICKIPFPVVVIPDPHFVSFMTNCMWDLHILGDIAKLPYVFPGEKERTGQFPYCNPSTSITGGWKPEKPCTRDGIYYLDCLWLKLVLHIHALHWYMKGLAKFLFVHSILIVSLLYCSFTLYCLYEYVCIMNDYIVSKIPCAIYVIYKQT